MAIGSMLEKEFPQQVEQTQYHVSWTFRGSRRTYGHSPMTSQGRFVVFRVIKDWKEVDSTLDRLGQSITTFQVVAAFKCLTAMGKLPAEAGGVLTKLAGIAAGLSDKMLPEHHATIISCCGEMQYWNSKMLNSFAKSILRYRLYGRLGTTGTVNIVSGLGKLHTLSVGTFQNRLRSGENVFLFSLLDLFMDKLGKQVSKSHKLDLFSPQQLVALLQGLARMRKSEPVTEWAWIIEVIKAGLRPSYVDNYSEKEMVTILWSLRHLGICCQETPVWFARELIHEDRMDDYTEEDLAAILYNLGVMEFYDVENMPYAIMAEIAQQHRLHKFSNGQLLTAVQGCAMLWYCEEIPFTALAQEIVNPERVPEFSPAEIIKVLDAFIGLEFKDRSTLSSLWKTLFNEDEFCRKTVERQGSSHPSFTLGYTRAVMNRFGQLGFAEWEVKRWDDPEPVPQSKTGFESPAPEYQLTDWTLDEHTGQWIPPLFRSRTAFRAGIGWKPLKEGRRVPLGRYTLKRKRQRQMKFKHQQEDRDLKKKQKEERLLKKKFHEERRAALRAHRKSLKKELKRQRKKSEDPAVTSGDS